MFHALQQTKWFAEALEKSSLENLGGECRLSSFPRSCHVTLCLLMMPSSEGGSCTKHLHYTKKPSPQDYWFIRSYGVNDDVISISTEENSPLVSAVRRFFLLSFLVIGSWRVLFKYLSGPLSLPGDLDYLVLACFQIVFWMEVLCRCSLVNVTSLILAGCKFT